MHKINVVVNRIVIRNRGDVSDMSINAHVLIQPDDSGEDVIRHAVPEDILVSELPKQVQDAAMTLIALIEERAKRQQGLA